MSTAITAESVIHAPLEKVWGILIDLDSYEKWNPFTPRVDSSLKIGEPVVLYVQMTPGKEIIQRESLTRLEPPHKVCWGMKMGANFLLQAERCQVLTDQGDGRTLYHTADVFQGLLTPLVMSMYGRHVERGFNDVAQALKAFAESS